MSHVVSIATELKDLEAIKAACKELGFTFKEGQQTYRWYGHAVGGVPEGFTKDEMGKCNHAIEVPGSGYDVGVVKKGDGYRLLFDFWGPGQKLLPALGGEKAEKFIQAYGCHKAIIEAQRMHKTIQRKTLADGTIELRIGGYR